MIQNRTRKSIYVLPNLITTANMFSGFLAIIYSMHSDHTMAAWFLILAAVFDLLDGRIARMAKATSAFGVEYDSLSDLVSFGVAPALVSYQWAFEQFGRLGWSISFLFLVCSALRLARFNVNTHLAPKGYFQGLPTPISCGVLATWILFLDYTGFFEDSRTFITLGMMILLPLLMVSLVPFPSFKEVNWRSRSSKRYFFGAIIAFVAVAIRPEVAMFAILVIYVFANLLYWVFRLLTKRSRIKKVVGMACLSLCWVVSASRAAAEESVQPYIDEIKAKQSTESFEKDKESEGYTQKLKDELPPEDPAETSAIQKFNEGRSDLHIKKRGSIHYDLGFRIGLAFDRTITPNPNQFQWNDYNATFGTGWNPDFQMNFGWMPFYDETFGSLGLAFSIGTAFNKGSWTPPGKTDESNITFSTIPGTLSLLYRLNLMYYVRPYVEYGPTLLRFSETRQDDVKGSTGFTNGRTLTLGAAVLLDWTSHSSEESLYDDYKIHHHYLTFETSHINTKSNVIVIDSRVFYVGFLFEY